MNTQKHILDVLTVGELQDILQIGRNTAYKLLESGKISSFKIGNIYKIPWKSLEEYINAKTN